MKHQPVAIGVAVLAVAAGASSPAHAIDRRVRIQNDSSHVIVEFYGANVGTRAWQQSLLGGEELPPGAGKIISFEDGSGYCRFRFRAVFDDGLELVRESVNICDVGTYRYTD